MRTSNVMTGDAVDLFLAARHSRFIIGDEPALNVAKGDLVHAPTRMHFRVCQGLSIGPDVLALQSLNSASLRQ